MPNQNKQPEYDPELCCLDDFFVPHPRSNKLNAEDAVAALLTLTKASTEAAWNLFEDTGKGFVNKASDDLVANLLWDILNKLRLIDKILLMATGSSTAQEILEYQEKQQGGGNHE